MALLHQQKGDWFFIDFEEDGAISEVDVEMVGLLVSIYVA